MEKGTQKATQMGKHELIINFRKIQGYTRRDTH